MKLRSQISTHVRRLNFTAPRACEHDAPPAMRAATCVPTLTSTHTHMHKRVSLGARCFSSHAEGPAHAGAEYSDSSIAGNPALGASASDTAPTRPGSPSDVLARTHTHAGVHECVPVFTHAQAPADAPPPVRGVPLLMLHGAHLSGRMFEPVLPALCDATPAPPLACEDRRARRRVYRRVVAPDLLGHGARAAAAPRFRLGDAVDDVVRITDGVLDQEANAMAADPAANPMHQCDVFGVSLGAGVALEMAVRSPGRVRRLAISGTISTGKTMASWMSIIAGAVHNLATPEQLARGIARLYRVPRDLEPALIEDIQKTCTTAYERDITAAMNRVAMQTAVRHGSNGNGHPGLMPPMLVLVGEEESHEARSAAMRTVANFPGSHGAIVPGAGQFWMLQDPDFCARVLHAWFDDRVVHDSLKPLTPYYKK